MLIKIGKLKITLGRVWVFAKANQMKDHKFNDDVTLVRAFTKKGAIKQLTPYYTNIEDKDVFKLRSTHFHYRYAPVNILTDY